MTEGRDVWWHDLVPQQSAECAPEPMDAEDLLYLLYTSGTTAQPKGIMHTTGGYLTQVAWTHKHVFDLQPDTDVYWCAADVGWVTGHSYIVYGPLANRATSVLYEGTPDYPDKDRLWEIVEKYGVTILYTAPTAIRTFMKWGPEFPERHDLSSLRLLGSVGEPINPEAWVWYWKHIGGERCPVVDTWWQTETGAIMISPLPGVTTLKPGSATVPAPRDRRRHRRRRRRVGRGPRRRLPRAHPSVAGDAARHLGRPGALPRHVLGPVPGPLLRGRRRQARRRRLLLAARAGRRRHARRRGTTSRPPRSSTRSSATRRSPRPRSSARKDDTTRPGDRRVRDPARRQRGERRARRRAARPRRPRTSARSPSRRRILFTEDLPKTRSGKIMRRLLRDVVRGPGARRHHHARRPVRGGGHQGPLPREPPPTRTESDAGRFPEHWTWHDDAGRSRAGRRRRHRRRALRRRQPPALPRGAAARLGRVLRGVRRRPRHRGGEGAPRPARPRPPRSCCSPPDPSGSTTSPRRGCAGTGSAGTCCSCARGATTRWPGTSSRRACGSSAEHGFDLQLAIEDDRRNVEMFRKEGVPCIYFHSGYYD